MLRPWYCAQFFADPLGARSALRRLAAAMLMVTALPAAQAQTITAGALAAAAIPVDHPGALLFLAVAMVACMGWMVRKKGLVSSTTLRSVALGAMAMVLGALVVWGDAVQAQLQELQAAFNQAGGETLTIPVQSTGTTPGGDPSGFLPVVYTNRTASGLRITSITEPTWSTCFSLGIPSPLPVTPARPGTVCSVGTALPAGGACWADVAALCAAAATAAQGNQSSTLLADTVSALAAAQATGNVLLNDLDPDGPLVLASFTYQGTRYAAGTPATAAGQGTLTMQSNGDYTFVAASPFTGASPLVVTYTVHTGASSTLSITVNRAPVAVNDAVSTSENTPVTVAVRGNDTDADGDPLTVASATPGAHGSVVIDAVANNPIYTPDAGFAGSDSFTYTINDGKGATSTATVTVTVNALSNGAPVANNDVATVDEASSVVIAVRGNDTDPDGDSLTVVGVTQGANGSVVIDAVTSNPIYTPNAGFTGTDTFTYTVDDGHGNAATGTVTVTVNPIVNQAPVAANDTALTRMDTAIFIPVSTLLANDTDANGDVLTLVSVQAAVNGTVSRIGNNVIFTPASGFEGAASFTYTIEDPSGASSTAMVNMTVGSATTPSLVILRSLVVNAHGTGGTSARFPITTTLVDTDGSESLSIRVSGVPTGVSFNAGVNLGGGVWQLVGADLPNLMLNLPGSYTTIATHLTVQVTSTETNGGVTASVSSVVTLKAAYTTVDITTTESGSYTGGSANEFIQGGNGNNTITASNGNNIVYGGDGDDNLSSGAGSDMLYGGSGNDTINAGSGADVISGGPGNDTLIGGDAGENFVDVFVWSLGDQGAAGTPAVDTIQNFATAAAGSNTAGGDVLDLRDLLQGEHVGPSNGAGNLADYLHFEISGGNTIIHISHTGGFAADSHFVGAAYTSATETQQIVLSGVDLQSLYSGATTDQQIITQLLNNNKLIVD